MTAIIVVFTLGYFFNKFNTIIKKENPIINESTIQNYYGTEKDGINLFEANQAFAISVVGTDG